MVRTRLAPYHCVPERRTDSLGRMSLLNDPLFNKLTEANKRVRDADERVDQLYRERGLDRDATIVPISGDDDELLVALKELKAANVEQGQILEALVPRTK